MNSAPSIFVAQFHPIVGDIACNAARMRAMADTCGATENDMVVFAELSLCHYGCEDLLISTDFIEQCRMAAYDLAATTKTGPALLIGTPWLDDGKLYNAALLLANGGIHTIQYKYYLPNYGVFDEQRYFTAGPLPRPLLWQDKKLGILICEDGWHADVAAHLKHQGAECLIQINASPYDNQKQKTRLQVTRQRVAETGLPLVYVHFWGGQDDMVFDGGSFALNAAGDITHHAAYFADDVLCITIGKNTAISHPPAMSDNAMQYQAMVIGLRDYVQQNGFQSVILGLSGGIDSALVACIAVDALGAENVRAVRLPSPYTSAASMDDAATLAATLGIQLDTISIEPAMQMMNETMAPHMPANTPPLVYENIQSRLRGQILMALSNATGALLLSTGNKSENAMGYATLYGDMCGAYNPVKDLYKTPLYAIARDICGQRIPTNIINRAPSAELRPNQTDQDTLPPYELLDSILALHIEGMQSPSALIAAGYDAEIVTTITSAVQRNEYKRRQSAPGPRLTIRPFARNRRMPMTINSSFYQRG